MRMNATFKRTVLFVYLIISFWYIQAQHYPYTIITLKDGLPQSSVFKTIQDKQGYIWMATENGVSKYDGYEFHTYSYHSGLDANYITDIEINPDGRLWVCGYGSGVGVFDGNSFYSFNTTNGFEISYIKDMTFTDDKNLWIASHDFGIVHVTLGFKPKIVDFISDIGEMKANAVYQLANGDMVGGGTGGLVFFKKGKENIPIRYPLPVAIYSIYEEKNGNIWVGGNNGLYTIVGDSLYDRSNWIKDGAIVYGIAEPGQDGIIYASTSLGLLKISNKKRELISVANGISYDLCRQVYKDDFGNLWLSTYGNGATILNDKGITHFDSDGSGGDMCTFALTEDKKENVWIGVYKDGFYIYNDSGIVKAKIAGLPDDADPIQGAKGSNGDLYLLTNQEGLYQIRDDKVVYAGSVNNNHRSLYGILPLKEDKVLLCTDKGAYILDQRTNKTEIIEEIPKTFLREPFYDDKGDIWIYGDRGEIFVMNNDTIKDLTKLVNPNFIGISHAIFDAKHKFYLFGTDKGLLIWTGVKGYLLHSGNVLKSDLIFSVTMDSLGRIWTGHAQGVECIDLEKMKVTHIGYDQGFLPIETNSGAAMTDSKGNVWFGTLTSATKIDVKQLESDSTTGQLRLEQIFVNEKLFFKENYFTETYPKLSLDHNQNTISFQIVSLCYANGKDVEYSWILEDMDKSWNTRVNTREIKYTNLPPGDYVFRAKAKNPNGYITNQINIKIHIAKPFWKTAGFYLFEIVTFLFIVFLSFRFSRQSSNNRLGQIMTLLTIFIIFESGMLYLSNYTDRFTNGIPVFQLVMNVLLAASLHPIENRIKIFMRKVARKKVK